MYSIPRLDVKWGHIKRLNQYVGQLPPLPQLNDREDQISHETVNLVPCSIVWKGIIALQH